MLNVGELEEIPLGFIEAFKLTRESSSSEVWATNGGVKATRGTWKKTGTLSQP